MLDTVSKEHVFVLRRLLACNIILGQSAASECLNV